MMIRSVNERGSVNDAPIAAIAFPDSQVTVRRLLLGEYREAVDRCLQ